jgi:hypothetical protein
MAFPKVVKVRQKFPGPRVGDVEKALREQLERSEIRVRVRPGMKVAITAGSRGISDIVPVLRTLTGFLKGAGAEPFVVPAMGSHGGATAEGQVRVLESLGVTEESVGAPVHSSMETVRLGETERGVPVFMDRLAHGADGVVVVGRVKQHTDFRSEIESGLMKMSAIGLGKHDGALALHALGVEGIRDHMVEAGRLVLGSGKVLFGVGIVENAHEETAMVEAIVPERVEDREKALLRESAGLMPKLPVSGMDVLFVDRLGKDYSGTGMDTNVIGRMGIPGVKEPEEPHARYIIVGDISAASHGNAIGAGLADFTTRRLFDKIDLAATMQNVVTSTFVERGKVPLVLENDRAALEAAVRCTWGVVPEEVRFVRIPNTLHLREVYLSENLLEEAMSRGNVEVVEEAAEMSFGEGGNFLAFERGR